ncbi:MAG: tape measure protein [Alphaproteobacteria bacterium]|nr:tape measure protein [Alphaproteobacteria bacterium]
MVAVTADEVVVEIEARLDKARADVAKYVQQFDQRMTKLESSAGRAERKVTAASTNITNSLKGMARSFAATAGISLGASALVEFIDAGRRVQNQLQIAGLQGRNLLDVQAALYAQAQRYGVELESLAKLYGRTSQGAAELGASQTQLLDLTKAVAAAIKIQGGDANEASGAILQLTQSLGSTIVRAEEFNSVNEGARPLLQAVADNIERFHGSVAALRNAVINGTLTSKEYFRAIVAGAQELDEKATKANLTLAQSFVKVKNAIVDATTKSPEVKKTVDEVIAALDYVASHMDEFFAEVNKTIATTRKEIEGVRDALEAVGNFLGKYVRLDFTPTQQARNLVKDIKQFENRDAGFGGLKVSDSFAKQKIDELAGSLSKILGSQAQVFAQNTTDALANGLDLSAPDYLAVPNIKTKGVTIETAQQKAARLKAERERERFAKDVRGVGFDTTAALSSDVADQMSQNFEEAAKGNRDYLDSIEQSQKRAQDYNNQLQEQADYLRATLHPLEDLRQKTQDLTELLDHGKISQADFALGLKNIQHEALLASATLGGGFANVLDELQRDLADINVFAGNIFGQLENAFKRAISSMISEALRLKIIKPLFGALFGVAGGGSGKGLLGSFFSSIFGGARAAGGPVQGGKSYLVGERGPEIVRMGGSGVVIPNDRIRGGGGQTIIQQTIQVDGRNSVTPENFARQILGLAQRQAAAMDAKVVDGAKKAQPGQLARFNKLGTTG